jgi:hypothetical protein
MRIGYLILVHKKPDQFARLFRAIYDRNHHYIVHVDKKSDQQVFEGVVEVISPYTNAILLPRVRVTYTGFGMVIAELRAIEKLLSIDQRWDFFINLSGQDFPLVAQSEIETYLARHPGKNFLDVVNQRREWRESLRRIRFVHLDIADKLYPTPIPRSFPRGIEPYDGSSWFILHRTFCEYLIESRLSQSLQQFFRYTRCPDEGFFQTVIMNSEFRETVVHNNLRYLRWLPTGRPADLRSSDFERMLESGALFARKFDMDVDGHILDRLEEHLGVPQSRS